MPIYEYKCNQCGKMSEVLVHGIDGHDVSCPECGGNQMERLLSTSYSFRMGSQAPGTTCCGIALNDAIRQRVPAGVPVVAVNQDTMIEH